MGTVSRHAGAPYQDGETLAGADLETDVNNIVTEINGSLDNSNLSASANIVGSKLADSSVTNAKMTNNTLTVAKMAASAVPKSHVSSASGLSALTSSTTYQDFVNITAATLTPGSTDDMIFMDVNFIAQFTGLPASASEGSWDVQFSIGTDEVACGVLLGSYDTGRYVTTHVTYATAAPGTSSLVIKPQYKKTSGFTGAANFPAGPADANCVFRCWILPGK